MLAAASLRPIRSLLLIAVLLIIYGSLYPGRLRQEPISLTLALLHLRYSWPVVFPPRILADCAMNVLIYIPLGWMGFLSLRTTPILVRLPVPMLLAGLLSLSLE